MKAVIDWFNGRGKAYDVDGKAVDRVLDHRCDDDDRDVVRRHAADRRGQLWASTGLKAIVPIAGVSSYYDHRRS